MSAYLVRGVLVDCAFPAVESDLLQAVRPRELRGVFVSHKHEDHAGNVEALARLGIPIALSDATRRAVSNPSPIKFYRRWTWGSMPPLRSPVAPFAPTDLSLIPTPGHSDDHHVVWDNTDDTVFAADLFLGVKVKVSHPGEDIRGSIASLRRVIGMRPRRLFDAHRGLIAEPVAALTAKANWMEATVQRIDELLQTGAGEDQIMKQVVGRERFTGWFSGNDYSRRNFVRSVISTSAAPR